MSTDNGTLGWPLVWDTFGLIAANGLENTCFHLAPGTGNDTGTWHAIHFANHAGKT